jgi:hypothetical protein
VVRVEVIKQEGMHASEVVLAGLRLLEDTERQHAIQLQALINDIAAGKASGEALLRSRCLIAYKSNTLCRRLAKRANAIADHSFGGL